MRFPGSWGSHISRQSAHEGGKVVSPTHRPPLPNRKYSRYSFLLEAESTPGPEGLCQWKIPMSPSGIEPASFRLASSNRATACPKTSLITEQKYSFMLCYFLPCTNIYSSYIFPPNHYTVLYFDRSVSFALTHELTVGAGAWESMHWHQSLN